VNKSRQQILADTGLFHKFWKGHNGEKILNTNKQKTQYLRSLCLKKTPEITNNVKWYSFCIMNNHPHETGMAGWDISIRFSRSKGITQLGNWMRNAHSAYGMWYNQEHQRYGKVACSRPKTTQIKSHSQVLNAMFYGDANPVRAGIVTHPSKYKWSSYNFYAHGINNEFSASLDPPDAYIALGKTPALRQKAYRSLLNLYLRKNGLIHDIPDENDELLIYDSIFDGIDAVIALAGRRNKSRPG
jgi:putative transposase